jgi:hypothetical protein
MRRKWSQLSILENAALEAALSIAAEQSTFTLDSSEYRQPSATSAGGYKPANSQPLARKTIGCDPVGNVAHSCSRRLHLAAKHIPIANMVPIEPSKRPTSQRQLRHAQLVAYRS